VGTAASIVLALLLALPVGALASPADGPAAAAQPAQTSSGVSANVTWDGTNIQAASTETSAFQVQFNGVVNLHYRWTAPATGAPYTVNDARLQIFYFGFALATRDVTDANAVPAFAGAFVMNWTTGPLQYLMEGRYRLVASLLEPNGTTVWSQTFWVQVAAPYYILAVLPFVLILIIIYELYAVATVGKQAALSQRKKSAPPPEDATPVSPSTTSPGAPGTTANTPPPTADTPSPPEGSP
jgi:hypothetical protein